MNIDKDQILQLLRSQGDDAKAQQEASGATDTPLPPLDEVRNEIVEQLEGGKASEEAQALIAQLRESADITVNL